jgi:hypothetical protein
MPIGGIAFWTLLVLAPLGWIVAIRVYLELRRWAHRCQTSRVAVAYKRRVVLEAPIVDWVNWANSLNGDEAVRGRVVYRGGHVSVAILKPGGPSTRSQAKVEEQT